MKKIVLYTAFLLCMGLCAVSCVKDDNLSTDGEGQVTLSLALPSSVARALATDFDDCDIRIYKYNSDDAKELIRRYFDIKDLPETLWLQAGRYNISVTLGNTVPETVADRVCESLSDCCFSGETDFNVESGKTNSVAVTCNLMQTIIEVVYDASIAEIFNQDFRTNVMIADEFNSADMSSGKVPSLTYETSKRGYFLLPADAKKFSYCFLGHSDNPFIGEEGEIHHHGVKEFEEGKRAGSLYKLTLRYSKNAGGFLADFSISYVEFDSVVNDIVGVNPSPAPEISGEGIEDTYVYTGGSTLEYTITCSEESEIKTVEIATGAVTRAAGDGEIITIDIATPDAYTEQGITVNAENKKAVKIGLTPTFFNRYVTGGNVKLTFTAKDSNNQEGKRTVSLRTSGTLSLVSTEAWYAKGKITAVVYQESPANVQIRYRVADTGDWTTVSATVDEENTYTADAEKINANTTYEYQLLVDGSECGAIARTTMGSGPQLPNAGFEIWGKDGNANTPYAGFTGNNYTTATDIQCWDTGNHGSTLLSSSSNLTSGVAEPRPESPGTTAAQLVSRSVVGKFAAGNIFVGKFLGIAGTNGVIGFGKSFDYTYRPKSVTFWYKGTVGSINTGSGGPAGSEKGESDVAQFYVLLCSNTTGPHIVDTRDKGTFMDLDANTIPYCSAVNGTNSKNDATGHIVAKAIWENTQSVDEWTKITVNMDYTEYAEEIPSFIIVTASASKYGDYFVGSTNSVMYLDDVEFVY